MMRVLVVLALLPACDVVFGIAGALDARPIDAPLPPPPCSQITMVGTNFDDGDLKTTWPGLQNVLAQGGAAVLDVSGQTFAAMDTVRFYDIRELAFSAKITAQGAFGTDDAIQLALVSRHPSSNVTITRVNGRLELARTVDGATFSMGHVDYVDQDYWRIHRHGRATDFDFSPDGMTWTTGLSFPDLDYLDFVQVGISTSRLTLSGFTVVVDDIEGGTPAGAACKVATLTDDFSAPTLGLPWLGRSVVQQNGMLLQHDGQLEMMFVPNPAGTDVHLIGNSPYDLADGAVTIEVPQMIDTTPGSGQAFVFGVYSPKDEIADFALADGSMLMARHFKGTFMSIGSEPYMASKHHWLRIRSSGTTMYWESSGDGHTWHLFGSTAGFGSVSIVDIVIQISGVATTPGHLVIDNVDLPPA